ncbi:MAG: VOC family protein [Pseudodesulfovibrio sp.]|uniref:Glyoxalase/bleomycin resistance protein/dioxygenase n=1 Tax=Pseudodesulfovibrio aespoeensis (strain ATCC 700646 / DSM 10631 / Aspo-2) TaxID=643562 RepID=E6VTJ2_PSEA9|nr:MULTISPECIES: VOC family protein [Pseudodesulfovibrio]MBU4192790.1 VOC family protein [Pseudomonadota bacterium]ADU62169.1 Glyoxalase/bleomycin resistance protein/dioxygenase [Pseudodesulfovibrio aespoeensis Aspo-2]MBU4244782.1 VOC family protein [Pseudomonadota bacterium]MBU4380522.1 VOC family protein [Pseudomonadota bacterium]MBU4476142.1 VOC family protein [Pseudomonadota bacterium]
MTMIFQGPALFVADIDASRAFYEDILGQPVLADHGPHVAFASGFSLWQADHATGVIYAGSRPRPATLGQGNLEMYFESETLDQDFARISERWQDIIHPVQPAPWGQRGFRLHDPDGHVVEVAEPLPLLVRRLLDEGLTVEQISASTSIPVEAVAAMAGGSDQE